MERVLARRLVSLVPESKTGLERLIDKKKISYDLQVELDQKKEEHATKMKAYKAKAEELEERNLQNLREVEANDRYIRDNCNKRQREEERLNMEKRALETKQKDLDKLKQELQELNERDAEIKVRLESALPYKNYLDSVFESSPELFSRAGVNEVQGIVNKFKTLKEWRGNLQVRLQRSKNELQKLQDAIKLYDDSSCSSTVEIDYQIKCISRAQEAEFKDFGHQRHAQEVVALQNHIKGQESATIRLSIQNMYKLSCNIATKLFGRQNKQVDDLEDKFDAIAIVLSDMLAIKAAAKEKNSAKQNLPRIGFRL